MPAAPGHAPDALALFVEKAVGLGAFVDPWFLALAVFFGAGLTATPHDDAVEPFGRGARRGRRGLRRRADRATDLRGGTRRSTDGDVT